MSKRKNHKPKGLTPEQAQEVRDFVARSARSHHSLRATLKETGICIESDDPEKRERLYQAAYYQSVQKERRRGKWHRNSDYREKEQARARRRRALRRAELVDARFDAMVADKKGAWGRTQAPRDVWVGGNPVRCYSSGSLGREVGREARTIRLWLDNTYLPGATAFLGAGKPDAYFSAPFCRAVKRACRRLYRLDARFPRDKLRGLVLEELAAVKESYVPVGGTEEDRVWPTTPAKRAHV